VRIGNVAGRLALITGPSAVDVAKASDGRFGPDPQGVFEDWDGFLAWARSADLPQGSAFDPQELGPPVPAPRQVLAVGLNYREHATESGFQQPTSDPPVFTKFPSCIVGPNADVEVPDGGHTDWEVELVAVVGRRAHRVSEADALSHLAGYTVGQDLSERTLQMAATPPQFSLGKSLPGFGPIGPVLVTLDEFADPDDLSLECSIDGEQVQAGRTGELIQSVPALIRMLSAVLPLLPGDIVFTGTPAGVGLGRTPQRWLQPGEVLTSHIEGIGTLRNRMVAPRDGRS
jgi:2-keto-4-pentenoate hydratase/2-oxohepta-3-ene-1,7-dioic acid hydratase in catechol pathway